MRFVVCLRLLFVTVLVMMGLDEKVVWLLGFMASSDIFHFSDLKGERKGPTCDADGEVVREIG